MQSKVMVPQVKRSANALQLEEVGRALLGDVVGGSSWVKPLERLLPSLGVFGGGLARVDPPNLFGLPTCGVADVVEAIAARETPPLTRQTRVDPTFQEGFVCDQMDMYRSARAKDRFCQEFLRPKGLTYQVSACVDVTADGPINFLAFRGPRSAGFDPADLATFSCLLPYLRAATMVSRSTLRLNADCAALPFESRGDPVMRVAHDGTALDCPPAALSLLTPDVHIKEGRLTAAVSWNQRKIDRGLTRALTERRPSLFTVLAEDKDSLRLLFVPIVGLALDVFHAAAALVIVLDVSRSSKVSEETLDVLARSVALTRRETDVARIIAAGRTPRDAANQLQISYETARLHLKTVFAKVGIQRQSELVALLHRLTCH